MSEPNTETYYCQYCGTCYMVGNKCDCKLVLKRRITALEAELETLQTQLTDDNKKLIKAQANNQSWSEGYERDQKKIRELEAEVSGRKQDAESLCTQIKELKDRLEMKRLACRITGKELTEERAKSEEAELAYADAKDHELMYRKKAEEAEAVLNDFHTMAEFAQTDLDASKGVSGGTVACRLRNELLAFVTLANQHKAREIALKNLKQ